MFAVKFLDAELRTIFKRAVRERWSKDKLGDAIKKVASGYYSKKQLKLLIEQESNDLTWLQKYTAGTEDYQDLVKYFNKSFFYYSEQQQGLNRDIIRIISDGFRNDLDDTDMINQLEGTLNRYQQHAKTIVNTAQQQFSMLKFRITAEEAGVEKFRYSGPPPQRPICKQYYQQIFTLKQIADISNRLGYDFFIERGKWNCRHFWEAVV